MKTYKVSLIPPNLRKNETIIQIADSLDLLSRVFDDIIMQVERRIDNYGDKLNNVSSRVKTVENKIEKLKHVKSAIQVFSSSKYPAADTQKGYISIFPSDSEIHMLRHKVSQKYPLKKDDPFDKLHIYHVKLSKTESENTEGLGPIPKDLNCISDLMLYNSGRNPYRNFSSSKPLQLSLSLVKAENKVYIGSAPASIAERSFSNLPNQEYFYSPDLGDVPSLDIPVDLPDLPGVASNVRYQDDNNLVIAPSVVSPIITTDTVENDIDPHKNLKELPEIIPARTSFQEIEKLSIPADKVEVEEKEPEPVKLEPPAEVKIQEKKVVTETAKIPFTLDSRASLMEAIREAGGKKVLKSIDTKPTSTKNEISGGNLMADLHAKLAMRRKGISGAKKNIENSEIDSRGALSLMSALIPAPEESNEETDQEEDWE